MSRMLFGCLLLALAVLAPTWWVQSQPPTPQPDTRRPEPRKDPQTDPGVSQAVPWLGGTPTKDGKKTKAAPGDVAPMPREANNAEKPPLKRSRKQTPPSRKSLVRLLFGSGDVPALDP